MGVKMKNVGAETVLPVPDNIRPTELEYDVFEGRDGAIVYLPKEKNPFKDQDYVASHEFDGDLTGFVEAGVTDEELAMK